MTDHQIEILASAIKYGLLNIGASDAMCIGTSPVEEVCKSLTRIAEALEALAETQS